MWASDMNLLKRYFRRQPTKSRFSGYLVIWIRPPHYFFYFWDVKFLCVLRSLFFAIFTPIVFFLLYFFRIAMKVNHRWGDYKVLLGLDSTCPIKNMHPLSSGSTSRHYRLLDMHKAFVPRCSFSIPSRTGWQTRVCRYPSNHANTPSCAVSLLLTKYCFTIQWMGLSLCIGRTYTKCNGQVVMRPAYSGGINRFCFCWLLEAPLLLQQNVCSLP